MTQVYSGRHEIALQRIEQMGFEPRNETLAEFRHFIRARCFIGINDQEKYQKEKLMITNKELLDQLEN